MSKENVKLFYETLVKDKALLSKLSTIGQKIYEQKIADGEKGPRMQKELVLLAEEAGFKFTISDLNDYAKDAEKSSLQELSEDELAAVAGGMCDTIMGMYCDSAGVVEVCPYSGFTCPNPGTTIS